MSFCTADLYFKSLKRFRMRQIIWMRWHESGFTWTDLRSGQGETCVNTSTHVCVRRTHRGREDHTCRQAETEQRIHRNQTQKHTHTVTPHTNTHIQALPLLAWRSGIGVVEKGWSYLCGDLRGHFPDWSPHMTSHQINLLTKSSWVTKHLSPH